MKTAKFMIFLLILLLQSGCKSPSSPGQQTIALLDKNIVADKFGDCNAVATSQELRAVDDYFATNDSAWCHQGCVLQDSSASSISAQQVRDSFVIECQFYPSEQAFRAAFQGEEFKSVWVSIVVLREFGSQIYVTSFYRAHGGDFTSNPWTKLAITN